MMKKRILLGFIAVLSINFAFAQQNFQLSQYLRATNLVNPAMTGMENQLEATAAYRQQWAGWTGNGAAPSTFYLSAHKGLAEAESGPSLSVPLRTSEGVGTIEDEAKESGIKHGVGGYVYNDKYGYFNRFSIGGSYAGHMALNDDYTLSGGLSLGVTSIATDVDKLTVENPTNDATYNDLINNDGNRTSIDAHIGVMIYSKNLIFGYSGFQLFQNKIYSSASGLDGSLAFHHNILGGYNIEASEQFSVVPSVLVQYVGGAPVTFDFSVKALYDERIWGGLALRNEDAIAVFVGAKFNDMISASYSYDINNSRIKDHSAGGHEIVVGIAIANKDQDVLNDYIW